MAAQQAFVVPVGTNWAVKVAGVRIGDIHRTQALAVTAARDWLKKHGGGELVILGEDGKIRDKDSVPPGNDPRNTPG